MLYVLVGCKSSLHDNTSDISTEETIAAAPADLLSLLPSWQRDGWDYQRLRSKIESNNIRSVDALLDALPKWLQTSFSLIHDSSDGEEATSLESPRVLLFSPDGKFILSYNVDPKINHVRIAQFVDGDERLALHEIRFDLKGQSPPKFSKENPSECLGCHNNDPKYHIQEYQNWTGWYGSDDDTIADGSAEDIGLQNLRKQAKLSGRLKNLSFPEEFPNYPYHRRDPASPKNSQGRGFSSMPNTRLTTALMRLQARIVHRRLRQAPKYDLIAPLLAFSILAPESDVIQFRPFSMQSCLTNQGALDGKSSKGFDFAKAMAVIGVDAKQLNTDPQNRLNLIRALFEAAGVSYDEELDLGSLIKATKDVRQDLSTRTFMDGFYGIRDVVLDLIWQNLVRLDRRFARYYNPVNMSDGVEFAIRHWGTEARYNRDYHFRPEQRTIFDNIAVAMIAPKGEASAFGATCDLLIEVIAGKLKQKASIAK